MRMFDIARKLLSDKGSIFDLVTALEQADWSIMKISQGIYPVALFGSTKLQIR